MVKVSAIDIDGGEPFRAAAARIVRVRARELFAAAEDVLSVTDIEGVHDMRVASRRLREVLEIFAPCFPEKEFKGVLRDVKRLADALGERRDPDVQIAALQEFAASQTPAIREGVGRLIEAARARQSRGTDILAAELERTQARGLLERLLLLADDGETVSEAENQGFFNLQVEGYLAAEEGE